MADLRVLSYLPNPRLAKATIAARLNGVDVEVRGAAPRELKDWLWDFDAHPLDESERANPATLRSARKGFSGGIHKTDAFLAAHPFGTVPAAFSGDGTVGVFESNSILRAVGRLGNDKLALYGRDPWAATRIDSFLDASLTFAIESQRYLFAFGDPPSLADRRASMSAAFETYFGGIDAALAGDDCIVGAALTLADIAFACETVLFALERHEAEVLAQAGVVPLFDAAVARRWPRAHTHFHALLEHPAFAPDLEPYYLDMTLAKLFA